MATKFDDYTFLVQETVKDCLETLKAKGDDYGKGNPFHNFEKAAALQGCTVLEAIRGMMTKHIISIYDILGSEQPENYTPEYLQEKFGDAINYLVIAKVYLEMMADAKGVVPKAMTEETLLKSKDDVPSFLSGGK